jgi:hypothetical protein
MFAIEMYVEALTANEGERAQGIYEMLTVEMKDVANNIRAKYLGN